MDNDENKDEEDWSKYASAGYSTAYDPWADLVPLEEEEEDDYNFDSDDIIFSCTPPPSNDGLDNLCRMGACNYCMARLSGKSFTWKEANDIGESLTNAAIKRGAEKNEEVEYCPFCEDLFVDIKMMAEMITEQLTKYEFKKMQLGAHFPKDQIITEDELRTQYGANGSQAIKSAFNDALGEQLVSNIENIELVKEQPEVMLLIDTLTLEPSIELRSLYLYGRYKKLERGIPQTRWPCRSCKGRKDGCESCEGTGQQYATSVQDQIGEPLRAAFEARDTAFHGMGREDIDVRCLGRGRPFVIEMKGPERRYADLKEMTELVNSTSNGRVEISELRISRRSEVARIKGTDAEKSYTIRFKIEGECDAEKIEETISSLEGETLEQQTPQRVAHRRADKIRKRKVVSISNISVEENEAQMDVRVESGTYVKELVHSDEGRTVPSVAGLLELPCEVIWLDVNDVHAD